MSHESSFVADPIFWYTIAVAIFVGIIWRYARKPVLALMDAEIAKIRKELEEAKRLRDEAAAALVDYRERQRAAMQEAQEIVDRARKEAQRLRLAAQEELKTVLVRYENKAEARIRLAETEAMDEVRAVVIEKAVETAKRLLAEKLDAATAQRIADQAIADIPTLDLPGSNRNLA